MLLNQREIINKETRRSDYADFYEAFIEVGLYGNVSRIFLIILHAGGQAAANIGARKMFNQIFWKLKVDGIRVTLEG